MANEEQLAILRQGVAVWNAWRQQNPGTEPDLSEADLTGAHLGGAIFNWTDFNRADLIGAHLNGSDLCGAYFIGARLIGAHLKGAHLNWAVLINANLSSADLRGAHLSQVDFRGAHLAEARLSGADLTRANLSGADLSGADLHWADLIRANLSGADLSGAGLRQANLSSADLIRANLSGTDLSGADLTRANLSSADLSGAGLTMASLVKTTLDNVVLVNATFMATILSDLDLSRCMGLDTARHGGPSTIGTDTLYRSRGKIPGIFLRGCGVPEVLIDYLPALVGAQDPTEFYSCFISYSSKDDDFARRLHERLRAEHLRVWFAPEDMHGGKKTIDQIEQAIHVHDRLLLVLSEESIQSNWVITEIKRARETELREQRQKLFPIRLTSIEILRAWRCVDADTGEDLASEIRSYHIPDFSNWKDHDAFEAAFAKLLQALRAAAQLVSS